MRLIDADAFFREFCELDREPYNNFPTIEAEPVRRGRWIAVDSYSAFGGDEVTWYAHGNPIAFYYCSECKEQTYADEEGNSILSKYCPNCGAKMGVDNGSD